MTEDKKILDCTCGSRSIWFNKQHPAAVYTDRREEDVEVNFGKNFGGLRQIHIHPDIICDFTDMPFEDESFSLVVWDPPIFRGSKILRGWSRNTGSWKETGGQCCMTDSRSA